MNEDSLAFSPDQFSGLARLFPLPNLVMFPHVMQAMHIFEPRYRAMFEEAVSDDKLIALGVLSPGWEVDYEGRPALESAACLCRIATYQQTPEGTYNVSAPWGSTNTSYATNCRQPGHFELLKRELLRTNSPRSFQIKKSQPCSNSSSQPLSVRFQKCQHRMTRLMNFLAVKLLWGCLADIVAYTAELSLGS